MAALITGINMCKADVAPPYLQNKTFDQNFNGVLISDLNGNLQFADANFALLHGYNEKELRGKHLSLFHTEEQMNREVIPFLEKAITSGHHRGTVGRVKKDGSTFFSRMFLNVLKNNRGVPIGLIFILNDCPDNPEPKNQQPPNKTTHQIETSAKKIVHDFNNFLHVIIGNIETTIKIAPEHTQIRSNLEEVLSASRRAQGLIQEILSPTSQDDHKPEPLQVPLVVKDTLKLFRTSLPSAIELSEDICKENGLVMADPAHIQRIVMNLCTNGYHAMEHSGGRLQVSIAEIDIDPIDSIHLDIDPGAYVCLSVSDTGHGIGRDIINRIFDPDYTTKANDKGHGLGLCIVREIVKSYQGDIKVCSEPGQGTVIDVYLPRIDYNAYRYKTVPEENPVAGLYSP